MTSRSSNEPIQIITWQCPHCLSEYDDYEQALACSRHPRVEPKYKVGDTVYVPLNHPADGGKLFAQVTVTEILDHVSTPFRNPVVESDYHQPLYVLSRLVQIGKSTWIGQAPSWQDEYEDHRNQYRPAPQGNLYQMGDSFNLFRGRGVITPELVTTDF